MWVKKNTCLWPPYKRDEIVKAVISQEPPGALWVPYKVRTILSKATYEEARVKLPEAERFTDLTDSEDSPHKRKRRRLKKNPFVQDDEESDDERQETSSLPSPPRTGTAKMLPHLSPLLSRSLNAGKSGNERTAISESVIRKFLTNQEIIKEQMGILVKLVYELKGNTEESPSLPPESLPIATLKDLQVLEGQLQDQEFKKTLSDLCIKPTGVWTAEEMFHIVIFESTNELEVVPEMWVKKNTCLWPPYKRDEIVKAVISQEPPGALWVPYKVRTILSKATYEEARVKLPEAERFTDLTDSEDSPHKRKRRRLKKNPFVQDDEESDDERQETSSLPSPPRTGTAKMLPHLSPLLSRSLNAGKSGNERTAISESVIRKFLTNQEIIKEQMGILVKLVYELKGNTEESPSLPPESLPIATLKDLQVLEGQLQDQEFKKTLSDLCIKPTGGGSFQALQ
ncbi:hypothetical protein MHYP_G00362060 [Metynnis hypsauchen]